MTESCEGLKILRKKVNSRDIGKVSQTLWRHGLNRREKTRDMLCQRSEANPVLYRFWPCEVEAAVMHPITLSRLGNSRAFLPGGGKQLTLPGSRERQSHPRSRDLTRRAQVDVRWAQEGTVKRDTCWLHERIRWATSCSWSPQRTPLDIGYHQCQPHIESL